MAELPLNENADLREPLSRSRGKSLQEHLAQGSFRADRHASLLNDSERPEHISRAEWALLRRVTLAGASAEGEPGNALTPTENAAYEQLIGTTPGAMLDRARAQGPSAKRTELHLGMLSPLLVAPIEVAA